ncbi:uncharacterized protein BXZ73DRAFT_103180 [Epithele typhae]|uniref:uncharacterized protein n=1 Tax=Epithele typhae TaxID=378194 RepID=UPI0020081B1F|nr:uncharacterized protein BXZ73DRAFT_103180 [Epithele typhae]KAH9925647.1 hypothetical protein BXZ73DRAFT_103180 [Epithele typhae]
MSQHPTSYPPSSGANLGGADFAAAPTGGHRLHHDADALPGARVPSTHQPHHAGDAEPHQLGAGGFRAQQPQLGGTDFRDQEYMGTRGTTLGDDDYTRAPPPGQPAMTGAGASGAHHLDSRTSRTRSSSSRACTRTRTRTRRTTRSGRWACARPRLAASLSVGVGPPDGPRGDDGQDCRKTEKVAGKMTKNPEMHERGELRETGGKARFRVRLAPRMTESEARRPYLYHQCSAPVYHIFD